MNIVQTLKQLRDDLKLWVTNNLNALNAKIDEKTIPIDSKLSATSTNPVQNKAITNAINNIPKFSGDYNDLTNAPNITEDDGGNMVIADEAGNIIFKADADGLHTTSLSLGGEPAATEAYVDEAIANIKIPEVDFTGYATEDFVSQSVETAKTEISESIVSETNEFHIVDDAGNIVASIDENGVATTTVTAQSVVINGNNVEEHLDDTNIHVTPAEKETWNKTSKTRIDWNASEGEAGHVLNRTHYDGFGEAYIEEGSTRYTPDENGQMFLNLKSFLYGDKEYTIGWAGTSSTVEYKCTSVAFEVDDGNGGVIETVFIGNYGLIMDGDDTGEPFIIVHSPSEGMTVCIALDGASYVFISIYGYTNKTVELPKRFIQSHLDELETRLTEIQSTYLSKNQGTENVGKIPMVGDDGVIVFDNIDIPSLEEYATDKDLEDLRTELSEHIVSENTELSIVDDDGHIIFSVDASGAHTTSLTLNGQTVEDIMSERVASLVDSAPDTLNTLNELASALGDDPNFATTVATEIGKKVDKVDGKGLSTNDFTNDYKNTLDNLGSMAFNEVDPTVPAWAKEETKPSYTADEVGALADTTVLADLGTDAEHRTVTDAEKQTWNAKSNFSGDYNDLVNAPDITEDGTGDLIIADANGNIIFRSNGSGFETTNLTVENLTINGMSIQELIRAYVDEVILGGEW